MASRLTGSLVFDAVAATETIDPMRGYKMNNETQVAELVGQVYRDAPAPVRGRLLEQLIKPLGILSLVAVANGVFAKISLGRGWSNLKIAPQDVQDVRVSDVVALANYVQQVSIQAIDGLAQIVATSPALTGSAAAVMLLSVLAHQSRQRPPVVGNDFDVSAG